MTLSEALTPVGVLVMGALAFGALLLVARPHAVVSYARAHELFLVGAVGIGALSLLLATAATLVLRR